MSELAAFVVVVVRRELCVCVWSCVAACATVLCWMIRSLNLSYVLYFSLFCILERHALSL